jgi:hypothetical protein
MKEIIKNWTLRISATALLVLGLLLIIILNPKLTYAHKTTYKAFTIYHNTPLDPFIRSHLDQVTEQLKTSEFYDHNFDLDICLNDGALYANIVSAIRGKAFAWGFYNKVVLQGKMNYKDNYVELNGYKWNLAQLLTHEITHCLQFNKLGFWNSNPIANISNWKWEGYAEYVSRQTANQKDIRYNLNQLEKTDNNTWEITLEDSTITSREYYHYWTLVQYCLDIKNMSYSQLLTDSTSEYNINQEMMKYYEENKNKCTTRTKRNAS